MLYVVIPVYNCEKYVHSAVSSILKQPYKNIKIIMVDDGSTDNSAAICDKLALDNNCIEVIHTYNQGVSVARNIGINRVLYEVKHNSRESYIVFLDADDAWEKSAFNDEIEELLDKGYDLIGYESSVCNNKMTKCLLNEPLIEGELKGGAANVWCHGKQCFGAMLYSCSFIEKYQIRFVPGLKYSEDKIFSMQCLYLADRVYLKHKLLYLYRSNDSSAMKTRCYGIDYYVPIIEAYIQSDNKMSFYKNEQRGELKEGRKLASVYIMDGIEEHIQNLGRCSSINKLLQEKEQYVEILNGKAFQGAKENKRYRQMIESPFLFYTRNYIKAIKTNVIRIARRNKVVIALIERRKYKILL